MLGLRVAGMSGNRTIRVQRGEYAGSIPVRQLPSGS